jgi:hypothetical protein
MKISKATLKVRLFLTVVAIFCALSLIHSIVSLSNSETTTTTTITHKSIGDEHLLLKFNHHPIGLYEKNGKATKILFELNSDSSENTEIIKEFNSFCKKLEENNWKQIQDKTSATNLLITYDSERKIYSIMSNNENKMLCASPTQNFSKIVQEYI